MTKGQKFEAVRDTDFLYTYKLGGGLLGRKVKKGDVVTFLTEEISFSTRMVSCYELLLCMTKNEFISSFKAI
jgi:hypothetical protein